MKPEISKPKDRICVICEGFEEYEYFQRIKDLEKWNCLYDFELVNAKGTGNVFPMYQSKYQNDSFDVVLVFCDADNCSQCFKDTVRKINELHGAKNALDKVVMFSNPCSMQIILSHFGKVALTTPNKNKNSDKISQLTGLFGGEIYDAKKEQRQLLFSKINGSNYDVMKENLRCVSANLPDVPSTNFLIYLYRFEDPRDSWINQINKGF